MEPVSHGKGDHGKVFRIKLNLAVNMYDDGLKLKSLGKLHFMPIKPT